MVTNGTPNLGLKEELRQMIRRSSAASGGTWTMKEVVFDQRWARLLALLMLNWIVGAKRDHGCSIQAVGGGVDVLPLASAIMVEAERRGHTCNAFLVRPDQKDHGMARRIDGEVAGRSVVLLEDTTGDGTETIATVRLLQAAGAEVLAVASVIDLEERAATAFAEDGIRFYSLFRGSELNRE